MRRFLAAVLSVALVGCGSGRDEREWPAPSPALWEMTAPDSGQAWLFGTIHALPDGLEWRTPALEEALEQSGVLVVEVAELGDSREAARQFSRRAHSPDLPPLLQRVPDADRPALEAALRSAGLDESDFSSTESWAAALELAGGLRRHESANGVDRQLIADAGQVIGLESLDQQFAMFDELAPQEQARLLVEVAREAGRGNQDEQVEAWLTGDLQRLTQESEQGMLADPALRDRLQLARNRAWADRVASIARAGERPFVAVGAAHMLGEEGLPALLAARGFSVRRVQ